MDGKFNFSRENAGKSQNALPWSIGASLFDALCLPFPGKTRFPCGRLSQKATSRDCSIERMISQVFTTPILRESTGLTLEQLFEIRDYLLGLREKSAGEEKSNRGGWHSSGNLFNPAEYRSFPAMQEAVIQVLFRYIGETFGYRGDIQLALTGWAVINGPGNYNAPHNHAANLLSGALYITVPPGMRGGEIVFQDPRLNLNAHETPAMRELGIKPPWMATQINVAPTAGDILVFPSWLMHYVEPFQSDDPKAVRIVVSFNASVG